jgi:hypothetical protein
MLASVFACKVHAQVPTQAPSPPKPAAAPPAAAKCLPAGNGYLRARLSGALKTELNWGNDGTECTGAVRPTDGGIRMRFSRADGPGKLVLVFGIAQLPEGRAARNLPVNVTLIREGAGEFFSTQGDDKCTLDAVTQDVIVGIPRRSRSYQVTARGFCTEPARAVRGKGAVLLSRFDYSGRVDFESQDTQSDETLTAGKQQ